MSSPQLSAQTTRRNKQFNQLFESLEMRRLLTVAYTVTDLTPNISGGSMANNISSNGNIALRSNGDAAVIINGTYKDLGFPGATRDINDAGQAVGYSSDSSGSNEAPFYYSGGKSTTVAPLNNSLPRLNFEAINASGDAVGEASDTSEDSDAVLYHNGKLTDLGTFEGGETFATGINDSGEIIGEAFFPATSRIHSWLYKNGAYQDLGLLPTGDTVEIDHAINNNGLILATANTAAIRASGDLSDIVSSADGGTLTNLTTSPAGQAGDVYDVNNSGTYVGFSLGTTFQGFVGKGTTQTLLNNLIDTSKGASIEAAYSINDSGKIVGLGQTSSSGSEHAVLLTPIVTGTITGIVYKDTNANGKQDAGETGIAGVSVFAGSTGFTTTAADGSYSITLAPGTYSTFAGTPSGYSATTVPSASLTVTASKTTTFNVGETPSSAGAGKSTINGTIFNDANGDGVQDNGETGIKGVTVTLSLKAQAEIVKANAISANAVPALTTVTTVTTDANGNYTFTGIAAGEYIVADTVPTADTQTAPTSGNYDVTIGLSGSQTISGKNFGLKAKAVTPTPTATVGGIVFNDLNGDGIQETGEAGIAGVVVTLAPSTVVSNITRAAVAANPTATTDSNGHYSFTNVTEFASYTLSLTPPTGYKQTIPTGSQTVNVSPDVDVSKENFGLAKTVVAPTTGTVGGIVFNDLNGNGKQDSSETGIAGVQVALVDKFFDRVTQFFTTTATGAYTFTAAGGQYTLTETPPTGYTQTLPTNNGGIAVTVNDGGALSGENFGINKIVIPPANTASIKGTVFNDANDNGKKDTGEMGLAGITITLTPQVQQKIQTDVVSAAITTTTDASGNYSFANLAAGTYVVTATTPSGSVQTLPTTGGYTVTLTAAQAVTGELFGEYKAPVAPTTGSISGVAFNDANGNGKRDAGESALAGVTITLDEQAGGIVTPDAIIQVATTTTNSSGAFTFTGIAPGTYSVNEETLDGYTQTLPANDANYTVTLAAGQTITGETFGQHKTAITPPPTTGSITGTVFGDSNNNGLFDNGEPAGASRTVFIDTNGNGILDAGEISTTTDAKGKYTFSGLTAGSYKVSRVYPAGFHLSNPSAGTGGHDVIATVTSGGTTTANLGSHEDGATPPPPPPTTGTITGTVFGDTNNDGTLNGSDEPTGSNRTVFLDTNGNGKLDAGELSTITDAKGHYTFANVHVGQYKVSRVYPAGFHMSNPSAGTGGKDILATVTGGVITTINIGSHENTSNPL